MRKDWKKLLTQFIKFGIVGGINAIISYSIYMLCIYLGMHYLLCNGFAFVISVFSSYCLNGKFVFKKSEQGERSAWKSLVKVYASYSITGIFLNSILLILWIDLLGVPKFLAPILNMCIGIPINFLLNKCWAYKGKKKKSI